ncbi:MAG TPA: VOC family protein [Chitinophagaceae bacterium]|nr:VOC family protein [Chitinophagaceae bacterium]
MKTRKIWANLGVEDLDRTTKFYSALGLKFNGASKELTSFFVGEDNFIIHFFLRDVLRSNIKGELADPKNGNEVIFTLSAGSREEVDNWEKEVKKAGGTIISNAEEFGDEYYGFVFTDPDGHKFNVFYMQGL